MNALRVAPGEHDRLTDIAGLKVGNAADERVRTGVTVVLPERPAVMAADVRGGAPGTRDTDALDPSCLVGDFHGCVLAGGSVFGLAAADGVTQFLSETGIGLPLGPRPIPVVPTAILFDLANGGDKDWGEHAPYFDLGVAAAKAAAADFTQGKAGAGYGAMAGAEAGGLGSASAFTETGIGVGALVAVNAFGAVQEGEVDAREIPLPKLGLVGGNTTIAVIATDLRLDKAGARRLAIMAHDGLARAIRPVHTPFDGDTVFAMATGEKPLIGEPAHTLTVAGTMAADCLARAVKKAVAAASSG